MENVTLPIVNKEGKEVGSVTVPTSVFGLDSNDALVHQAFTIKTSNARNNYAHTKTRADVRGGGAKPWRQKGTGRARHGSNRSPIWVGGGVTFGPRNERNFSKKLSTKMNRKAIATVLSAKVRDDLFTVVDSLAFAAPKTKEARAALDALGVNRSVLVLGTTSDENFVKSFRNIEKVTPRSINRINIVELLKHARCIVSQDALQSLITVYADSNEHSAEGRVKATRRPSRKA